MELNPSETSPLVVRMNYQTHPPKLSVSPEREYGSEDKEGVSDWSEQVGEAVADNYTLVYSVIPTGDHNDDPIRFLRGWPFPE